MSRGRDEAGVDEQRGDGAVNAGGVLMVAGGIVLGLVVVLWLLWRALAAFAPWALETPMDPPPAPHSSAAHWSQQRETLERLRRREEDRLNTPAWLDRDAGVARIPIEAAMRLYATRTESIGGNKAGEGEGPFAPPAPAGAPAAGQREGGGNIGAGGER